MGLNQSQLPAQPAQIIRPDIVQRQPASQQLPASRENLRSKELEGPAIAIEAAEEEPVEVVDADESELDLIEEMQPERPEGPSVENRPTIPMSHPSQTPVALGHQPWRKMDADFAVEKYGSLVDSIQPIAMKPEFFKGRKEAYFAFDGKEQDVSKEDLPLVSCTVTNRREWSQLLAYLDQERGNVVNRHKRIQRRQSGGGGHAAAGEESAYCKMDLYAMLVIGFLAGIMIPTIVKKFSERK